MLTDRREHPPAPAPLRTAAAGKPAPAGGPSAQPPRLAERTADALDGLLAREVAQRETKLGGAGCCEACRTGSASCDATPSQPTGEPLRAHATTLQRRKSDKGALDSLWDTAGDWFDDAKDAVEAALASAGSKLDTALELSKYPTCQSTIGGPPEPPALELWLDDKGLEALRNGKGVLSKTSKPKAANAQTLMLFKNALQSWGCDALGLDLLPKAGITGPYGPETAAAVKQLQLFSFLSTDGVVGAQTIAALDAHLGSRPSDRVEMDVGGSAAKGRSVFDATKVPAGRVYFANDDASLDDHDQAVLEDMANELAKPEREVDSVEVSVVGYADKRENALYNVGLSLRRAAAVHDHLKPLLLERYVDATLTLKAKGEIERRQPGTTDEELKPFRRVDIHLAEVKYTPPAGPVNCLEPATKWEAMMENTMAWEFGLATTIGAVGIRMRTPDSTGRRWMKKFKYAGVGAAVSLPFTGPVGYSKVNDWAPFDTSVPMQLKDFQGRARFDPAGIVLGNGYSHDLLWLDTPQLHGGRIAHVTFHGESEGWGVGFGFEIWGNLASRGPCTEVEEPFKEADEEALEQKRKELQDRYEDDPSAPEYEEGSEGDYGP